MKRCSGCLLLALLLLLLSGCSPAAVSPDAVSPDAVSPDAVNPDTVSPDTLLPHSDYGQLYPYVGRISPISYFSGLNRLTGLVDGQGRIVLGPVLLYADPRTTTDGEPYWELVYEPDDVDSTLLWKQLAAGDGSWVSPKYLCSYIEYNLQRVIVSVWEDDENGDQQLRAAAYDKAGQFLGDTPVDTAIYADGYGLVYEPELNAYYYVDTEGKQVFRRTFRYASPFSGGLAIVSPEEARCTLLNSRGEFLFSPDKYTLITEFQGGYSIARGNNGLLGLIDTSGKEIFPPAYNQLYWLNEDELLLAGEQAGQIHLLNPLDGSTEPLTGGLGYYGEGWLYSQDRMHKEMILYKDEIERFFSVAGEEDWGNRLDCRYLGGDLFALSYQYRLPLVLTTGETVGGDIDKERSRLDFYNAATDQVVKSLPRYEFQGRVQNGFYEVYDWDMWGNGVTMLLDTTTMEPLFGQSFSHISYLGNDFYSIVKDNYAGILKTDGSWLIRVELE